MQDKQLQDSLVSLAVGRVLTLLIGVFILGPIGAAWWWYVLTFLVLAGVTGKALTQNRAHEKVAYDKGVAVKPTQPPAAGAGSCTQCGISLPAGA